MLIRARRALLPVRRPVSRLRPRSSSTSRAPRHLRRQHGVVAFGAVLGFLLLGPVGGCVAAGLTGIAVRQRGAHRQRREQLADADALLDALRLVVAQLRAGAHPAEAAEGAARDCPSGERGRPVGDVLARLASATRLGAGVDRIAEEHVGRRVGLAQLCRVWELAHRHGLSLTELLDSLRRNVQQRTTRVRDLESKMAGPRATAALLAVLPLFGLLMGESLGAGPIAVLSDAPVGQVLVLVGGGLLCAGLCWTHRLTALGVRP